MAKSKAKSLRGTKASLASSSVKAFGGLPEYSPFTIVKVSDLGQKIKIWFEKNTDTYKTARDAGIKLFKGGTAKKWLVKDESILTHSLRIILSRAFSLWASDKIRSKSEIKSSYYQVLFFIEYCEQNKIYTFPDLDNGALMQITSIMRENACLTSILSIVGRAYQLPDLIKFSNKRPRSLNRISNINPNELFGEKEYPEEILMQIIGYVIYHLNIMFQKQKMLDDIDKSYLEGKGALITIADTESYKRPETNSTLGKLYREHDLKPELAVELLFQNLLLCCKIESSKDKNTSIIDHKLFTQKVVGKIALQNANFWRDFRSYFKEKYGLDETLPQLFYYKQVTQKYPINTAAILLFIMMQTGCNKEVISSLQRDYNGLHWTKRFDTNLGVDSQTLLKKQVVRVTGYKARGKHGKKPIDIRVPVNSYLYNVLLLTEKLFSAKKSDLFFSSKIFSHGLEAFCAQYHILDNDKILESIDTTKIRKCYAGLNLIKAINESNDGVGLTRRLRDALNHESFDTTLFSYLLKSGTGNYAISNAIATLTTKMVEDALTFKGQIVTPEKQRPNDSLIPVFLCDCEDPTKPTHDIPIATRCTQYDLCLGCERSQVHAEHISRICYRIYQYDQAPSPVSDVLADRKAIALDLIERFQLEHPDGELIVVTAYQKASEAMLNNISLLPPIL